MHRSKLIPMVIAWAPLLWVLAGCSGGAASDTADETPAPVSRPAPTLSVRITTGPSAASWRIDDGPWLDAGADRPLPAGTFTLSFRPVSGWNEPASRTIDPDAEGGDVLITVSYLAHTGTWKPQPSATAFPWTNDRVEQVVSDGADRLAAIGGFTKIDTVAANRVAIWDGSHWRALGTGLNAPAEGLAFWKGDLYAGGFFTDPAARVACWNGAAWTPLGPGLDHAVRFLGTWNDRLIAGGQFTRAGTLPVNHIAAWDGRSWSALGTGTDGYVFAFVEYQGDLIVTGAFTFAGGQACRHIARWDGSGWQPLAAGLDAPAYALAVYQGRLYATGDFLHAGGKAAARIACWDGDTWRSLAEGLDGGPQPFGRALTVWNGRLVVGGGFTRAGSWNCQRIAAWDGNGWSPLGAGLNQWVESLTVHQGALQAGGWFNHLSTGGPLGFARWVPAASPAP